MGWFAMMYSQDGKTAMPIVREDDHGNELVKFWPSEAEAHEELDKHPFAKAFGYELFEM